MMKTQYSNNSLCIWFIFALAVIVSKENVNNEKIRTVIYRQTITLYNKYGHKREFKKGQMNIEISKEKTIIPNIKGWPYMFVILYTKQKKNMH